jgi:sigma-B regulation protein RsbQ
MVIARNNVRILGQGTRSVVFAHGFGCDQEVWRWMTPAFRDDHRLVLFDHVGSGGSDLLAYNPARYDRLHAYAEDVLEVCEATCGDAPIFVGHSVAASSACWRRRSGPDAFPAWC